MSSDKDRIKYLEDVENQKWNLLKLIDELLTVLSCGEAMDFRIDENMSKEKKAMIKAQRMIMLYKSGVHKKCSEMAEDYATTIYNIDKMSAKMKYLSKHMMDDDFNEDKY